MNVSARLSTSFTLSSICALYSAIPAANEMRSLGDRLRLMEDLSFSKSAGGDVLDNINFSLDRFVTSESICEGEYYTSSEVDGNYYVSIRFDESRWKEYNRTSITLLQKVHDQIITYVRPFLAF